jgi:hypothetical protein
VNVAVPSIGASVAKMEAARMDEALQGLADPALSLATLADRLGYAEPSAFSHAVRGHFGDVAPRIARGAHGKCLQDGSRRGSFASPSRPTPSRLPGMKLS